MSIYRCNNQVATFNKRSAALKASAIADGMNVHTEWKDGEFQCFMASHSQATLLAGKGIYAECGANVNGNPCTWTSGRGKVWQDTYLQK